MAYEHTMSIKALISAIEAIDDVEVFGRVKSVQGLLVEIVGPVRELRVGGRVIIEATDGNHLAAEIIGFRDGHALCLPFGELGGVRLGCKAVFRRHDGSVNPSEPCPVAPTPIRCASRRWPPTTAPASASRSNWACAASTPSPPCAKASAWASLPAQAWASRC